MREILALISVVLVVTPAIPTAVATASDPGPELDPHTGTLQPVTEDESQAYRHVRYVQTIDGFPVQDAAASHHVPLDGGEGHWTSGIVDLPAREFFQVSDPASLLNRDEAIAVAQEAVDVRVPMPDHKPEARTVWTPHDNQLLKAHEVRVPSLSPPALWRVTVDATTGDVLEVSDRSLHLDRPARVFDVNPIVALQEPDFRDNHASIDSDKMRQASTTVTIRNITDEPGLATDNFRVVDSATHPGVTENLTFRRDDPRFLEANALGWLQHAAGRVEQAGYSDLLEDQVDVYAHQPPVVVMENDDGPMPVLVFPSPFPEAYETDGELHFLYRTPSPTANGTGSSAEDADTIGHELGHLLLSNAQPTLTGEWRNAIHEGTAMIVSALVQPEDVPTANRACEGEWIITYLEDSRVLEPKIHEGFPCLRILDHNRTLEDGPSRDPPRFVNGTQTQYWQGEVLAGAVFDLGQAIGWNSTLELYLEAMYLFPEEPEGFEDVGDAVARADCALNDCSHFEAIQAAFGVHGIEVRPPTEADLTEQDTEHVDPEASSDQDENPPPPEPGSNASAEDETSDATALPTAAGLVVLALVARTVRRR